MHGTVAIVHKCTIMHKLMCVIFSLNCVKSTIFFILHNYDRADVIALSLKQRHVSRNWIKFKSFYFSSFKSNFCTSKSNYISSVIIVQNEKSGWFYTIWRKKDTHQLMHNCAFMHNCYSAGAYIHWHCRASI